MLNFEGSWEYCKDEVMEYVIKLFYTELWSRLGNLYEVRVCLEGGKS